MVEIRRLLQNAMNILANWWVLLILKNLLLYIYIPSFHSFPDIKCVTTRAEEVDYWQPKHVQLEALGVLWNFSEVEDLQNTDPDLEALQSWLQESQPDSQIQVNFDSLNEIDFTIPLKNHQYQGDMSDLMDQTDGDESDISEKTDGEDKVVSLARWGANVLILFAYTNNMQKKKISWNTAIT